MASIVRWLVINDRYPPSDPLYGRPFWSRTETEPGPFETVLAYGWSDGKMTWTSEGY